MDDLYTPEINHAGAPTDSEAKTAAYDALKIKAILNQIRGRKSDGAPGKVPAILSMNFQALSVAQKTTGDGTWRRPSISWIRLSAGWSRNGRRMDRTLIVVSAKHGQSPIDRSALKIVDSQALGSAITAAAPAGVAQLTTDTVGLVWLKDGMQAEAVVIALNASKAALGIDHILSGVALRDQYGDPASDRRVPDLMVIPTQGVIYTEPTATKIAEHGGFSENDTHLALLVSAAGLQANRVDSPVSTTQVAPTLLSALGLDPNALRSVVQEGTAVLPLK